MLNVLDDHRVLAVINPVEDAPLGTETRAVQPGQTALQRFTHSLRCRQQWAGEELNSRGGNVFGQQLGDGSPRRASQSQLENQDERPTPESLAGNPRRRPVGP